MPVIEIALKASAGDDKGYIQGATIDEAKATIDLTEIAMEINKEIPSTIPFVVTPEMVAKAARTVLAKADANDLVPGDGMFEIGIHWAKKIATKLFGFIRISDGVHVDAGLVISVTE